jgi:predicted AAA+ superfamily ATPase
MMQSIFENIIFIELLYRGYDVKIGKFDEYEVDFIAQKSSERLYIQVC